MSEERARALVGSLTYEEKVLLLELLQSLPSGANCPEETD